MKTNIYLKLVILVAISSLFMFTNCPVTDCGDKETSVYPACYFKLYKANVGGDIYENSVSERQGCPLQVVLDEDVDVSGIDNDINVIFYDDIISSDKTIALTVNSYSADGELISSIILNNEKLQDGTRLQYDESNPFTKVKLTVTYF